MMFIFAYIFLFWACEEQTKWNAFIFSHLSLRTWGSLSLNFKLTLSRVRILNLGQQWWIWIHSKGYFPIIKKIHWPTYFLVLIFGVSWEKCNCHAFKFSASLSTHACNSGKWKGTWSSSFGINEHLTLYWRIYAQAFWSVQ